MKVLQLAVMMFGVFCVFEAVPESGIYRFILHRVSSALYMAHVIHDDYYHV